MADPLETFQAYMAMKVHFNKTADYDYFKYNGYIKSATDTAFHKRNDKYFFGKIAKKVDTIESVVTLFAYNFFYDPNVWIGKVDFQLLKNHNSYMDSFSYMLERDMKNAQKVMESNGLGPREFFVFNENEDAPPFVFNEIYSGEDNFSLTSYMVLNYVYGLSDMTIKKVSNDIDREDLEHLKRFEPFFNLTMNEEKKNIAKQLTHKYFAAKENA